MIKPSAKVSKVTSFITNHISECRCLSNSWAQTLVCFTDCRSSQCVRECVCSSIRCMFSLFNYRSVPVTWRACCFFFFFPSSVFHMQYYTLTWAPALSKWFSLQGQQHCSWTKSGHSKQPVTLKPGQCSTLLLLFHSPRWIQLVQTRSPLCCRKWSLWKCNYYMTKGLAIIRKNHILTILTDIAIWS